MNQKSRLLNKVHYITSKRLSKGLHNVNYIYVNLYSKVSSNLETTYIRNQIKLNIDDLSHV